MFFHPIAYLAFNILINLFVPRLTLVFIMSFQCTVGTYYGGSCHLTTYCKKTGSIELDSLDYESKEIILWRSGLSMLNINASICLHHQYVLLKRFPMQQKSCCNPFKIHHSIKKGTLYCLKIQ